jgi:hypothetical protein
MRALACPRHDRAHRGRGCTRRLAAAPVAAHGTDVSITPGFSWHPPIRSLVPITGFACGTDSALRLRASKRSQRRDGGLRVWWRVEADVDVEPTGGEWVCCDVGMVGLGDGLDDGEAEPVSFSGAGSVVP